MHENTKDMRQENNEKTEVGEFPLSKHNTNTVGRHFPESTTTPLLQA